MSPQSTEDAFRCLIALNEQVNEKLLVAARNAIPEEVAEELDTLWRNVDALCRHISMIQVTMRDI